MIKQLFLAISIVLCGCAGQPPSPAPMTPPKTQEVKQETPKQENQQVSLVSTTTKVHKGTTWSVELPENLIIETETDDEVMAKVSDGSLFAFGRQTDTTDLESFTSNVLLTFLAKGIEPNSVNDFEIGQWPAKMLVFVGRRGVSLIALVSTGTHCYSFVYAGQGGKDRVLAYKTGLDSVQITDKPVVKKVAPKAPTTPSKK